MNFDNKRERERERKVGRVKGVGERETGRKEEGEYANHRLKLLLNQAHPRM